MRFYFNCNNITQAKILARCGVKNAFLNHKYVKKNIAKMSVFFDKTLVSPSHVYNEAEYYDWLEDTYPPHQLALQYDYDDPIVNMKSFKEGKEYKENLIPIFHGRYSENLTLFKPLLIDGNIIALGRMKGMIEEDEMLRRLPSNYDYHGLGKGRWANKNIHSVDSSTWLSGVRGRKTDVFKGQQITFGKKGLTNKSYVQMALTKYSNHVKTVGLKQEEVLEGDYNSLMKVTLAVYYMPMFESLGIYKDNFIS